MADSVVSTLQRSVCVEIDRTDLESAVRQTVVDRARFVVGRVRRRQSSGEIRLILDRFRPVNGLPSGNHMPSLHDWAVLTCAHRGQPATLQIPSIVEAARSQLLVCLRLDSEHLDQLSVVIWDRGQLLSADSIRISGSGSFELPPPQAYESFDMTPERRQFLDHRDSRTVGALGEPLLTAVRRSCLVNVGAGGGGSALAVQLASFRPRRLMIFDGDVIGPENLNAMPHAAEKDANNSVRKVEVLASTIEANQPDLHVNASPWPITEGRSIRLLTQTHVDAFFSFVDNDAARLCTSHLAREGHAVHIDVGTRIRRDGNQRIMQADIRLFEAGPGRGCVLCVPQMPVEQRDDAFYELNAPERAMHKGQPIAWNDPEHGRAGSLLLLNSVAASMAVDLWLAWLDGRISTSHWLRVTWTFGQPLQVQALNVTGVPGCQFCGVEDD